MIGRFLSAFATAADAPLLRLREHVMTTGGEICLLDPSSVVVRLLEVCGLADVFAVDRTS